MIVKQVEKKHYGIVIEELDEQGRIIGEPCFDKVSRKRLFVEESSGTKDAQHAEQNTLIQ